MIDFGSPPYWGKTTLVQYISKTEMQFFKLHDQTEYRDYKKTTWKMLYFLCRTFKTHWFDYRYHSKFQKSTKSGTKSRKIRSFIILNNIYCNKLFITIFIGYSISKPRTIFPTPTQQIWLAVPNSCELHGFNQDVTKVQLTTTVLLQSIKPVEMEQFNLLNVHVIFSWIPPWWYGWNSFVSVEQSWYHHLIFFIIDWLVLQHLDMENVVIRHFCLYFTPFGHTFKICCCGSVTAQCHHYKDNPHLCHCCSFSRSSFPVVVTSVSVSLCDFITATRFLYLRAPTPK